mgnify:CR=1 FL=1
MIELYHFWDSPCCFKVRAVLAEKELDWTAHLIASVKFDHFLPAYQAINPHSTAPTLIHDGQTLLQSRESGVGSPPQSLTGSGKGIPVTNRLSSSSTASVMLRTPSSLQSAASKQPTTLLPGMKSIARICMASARFAVELASASPRRK